MYVWVEWERESETAEMHTDRGHGAVFLFIYGSICFHETGTERTQIIESS